jgi:hypothetical protein
LTQHVHDGQKLLVAVSAFNGAALILSAIGQAARAEIISMSSCPDEWDSLSDDRPKEPPGLYVWEGRIITEDGHGTGEYGGRGDQDFEWQGKWRGASVRDLLEFGLARLAFKVGQATATHEVRQKEPRITLDEQIADARMTDGALAYPVISPALAVGPVSTSFNERESGVEDDPTAFGKFVGDSWLVQTGPDDGYLTVFRCRECNHIWPMTLAPAREHVRRKHGGTELIALNGCEWCHGPMARSSEKGAYCVAGCAGSRAEPSDALQLSIEDEQAAQTLRFDSDEGEPTHYPFPRDSDS